MIAYIRGIVGDFTENTVVVETEGGLGYEVMVPQTAAENLPGLGKPVLLYTYLQVKEDGAALFGFLEKEELAVFKLLIQVNGIGPKGALGILSAISVDELRFAILAEDTEQIAKAPGIGKKTAGKLILELKDKISLADTFEHKLKNKEQAEKTGRNEELREEAVMALAALGYSQTQALKAVRGVPLDDTTTVEDIVKQALKTVGL